LSDLDTLVYLDNLCSRLGLDSISAGNAMAFAMDLFERKILTCEDTGGLDLSWGNGISMESLIRQMASGEGLGATLAKGVRRAAQIIGRGADYYAAHVKGLEMSGYHPDNMMGTALGYAVASRGADFNDVYSAIEHKWLPDEESEEFGTPKASDLTSIHGKAELVRRAMIVGAVVDSLGLCKVPTLSLISAYDLVAEAELATELTDETFAVADLFAAGERIVNTERLINLRCGVSDADDRLPDMFFDKDYNSGRQPSKPSEWMEPMKKEFYSIMGWDEKGRPTAAKLAELGIKS
jgi:aldehyde:ferredoxin oxidoreductase